MIKAIVRPNSIALPTNYDLVRVPPTLDHPNSLKYFSTFDFHTVFSDIFLCGEEIRLVGPPYLNLREVLAAAEFRIDGGMTIDAAEIRWEEMDRMSRTSLPLIRSSELTWVPETVSLVLPDLELSSQIGASHWDAFEGTNALVTMNRNNRLETIVQWVELNVQANDVDALLLFDNRSTWYSSKEVLDAVSAVDGIKTAVVVEWPHPYGALSKNLDSDFGQYTAWETAHWRFLKNARTVIICDVDELMLSDDGRAVSELALETGNGVLYMRSSDVPPVVARASDQNSLRQHSDFIFKGVGPMGPRKYCYVPNRLLPQQQLKVHAVSYAHDNGPSQGTVRHFKGLHMAWREGLNSYSLPLIENLEELEVDSRLFDLFQQYPDD